MGTVAGLFLLPEYLDKPAFCPLDGDNSAGKTAILDGLFRTGLSTGEINRKI